MAAKPLIYVAGPITADPYGAIRSAIPAFHTLRAAGCVPFLPQYSVIHEMIEHLDYEDWMAYDFDVIRRCDGLLRLPGVSAGAAREAELARELDLPVLNMANLGGLQDVGWWVNSYVLPRFNGDTQCDAGHWPMPATTPTAHPPASAKPHRCSLQVGR